MTLGRSASALVSLNDAVTAAPEDPEPASELGLALGRVGFLNEAVKWFERALKIDRHYAPAYRYMGNALTMMRLDREALVCLREARRLRPDWNEAWLDEAGLLLRGGRLQEGWQAYERRQSASMARRLAGDHYWLGDADLTDQSIILMAEQGLGDTLNFVRYAPPDQGDGGGSGHRRGAALAIPVDRTAGASVGRRGDRARHAASAHAMANATAQPAACLWDESVDDTDGCALSERAPAVSRKMARCARAAPRHAHRLGVRRQPALS